MVFSTSDYIVIAIYFCLSIGLGLWLSRRGGGSLLDYILSGRSVPWWLVGTGMVATTFAADTPLAVTELVGGGGISANWIWWSMAAGGMLTVFFFSRLWRRAEITTDLEFIELRYTGRPAEFLRGVKSIYFGFFLNIVVMAWVNLAMVTIAKVTFPSIDPVLVVTVCAVATMLYVVVSGLWGVMIADFFQFAVALIGCALLAFFALQQPALSEGLTSHFSSAELRFIPDFTSDGDAETQVGEIAIWSFLAFVLVQWWASWYPGSEPGGGGYIAQRIMSARDERHGMLATLWFTVAHYCVRTWPWILAALVAVVLYPGGDAAARRESYIQLIADVLPSPLRGLLIAAFIGAYMSTISTHLNWGASYLVNDFYKRFLVRDKDDAHYLGWTRIFTVVLLLASLGFTFLVLLPYEQGISDVWKWLIASTAGMGFILILRWYWWRVNAWSEITSMVGPILIVLCYHFWLPTMFDYEPLPSPQSLFVIVPISIGLTLIAMYVTRPEPHETLSHFFNRVRPPGPGWARIRRSLALNSRGNLWLAALGWFAGVVLVYAALFGPGAFFLGRTFEAIIYSIAAIVSGVIVFFVIKKDFREN